MDIKNLLAVPQTSSFADGALLFTRFVAGLGMMAHGQSKILNPFGWMGEGAFAPGIFQALAAVAEFGGGLALLIGFLTPLASLGIGATMVVAIYMHAIMKGDPFVAKGGGGSYELAAIYLSLAILIIATGPGRFSVDRAIFGSRRSRGS
jgi:putative oxidoreductase